MDENIIEYELVFMYNYLYEIEVVYKMKLVQGGVTAPIGYFATGVASGIKKDNQPDLSIVCSEDTAVAAGVFTQNKVKGHSLQLTMNHIKNGYASAVFSGYGVPEKHIHIHQFKRRAAEANRYETCTSRT